MKTIYTIRAVDLKTDATIGVADTAPVEFLVDGWSDIRTRFPEWSALALVPVSQRAV
jgi:hypothetical protein